MYLSEIAPVKLRGSLGTLNQFGIVTGLLLGFITGLKQVSYLSMYLDSFLLYVNLTSVLSVVIFSNAPFSCTTAHLGCSKSGHCLPTV